MAVKTTGAEFKRFYNDIAFWPEGTWHEDEFVTVDGEEQEGGFDIDMISNESVVRIAGGIVFGPQFDQNEPSFEGYFKRWRKLQTTTTFVVECDIAKVEAVKAAVKAAGGRCG